MPRSKGSSIGSGPLVDFGIPSSLSTPPSIGSSMRVFHASLPVFALSLVWLATACSKSEASPQKPAPVVIASATAAASNAPAPGKPEKVLVPAVAISDKAQTTVHVTWDTPPGTAVNEDAPFRVRWTTSEGLAEVPPELRAKGRDVSAGFDVPVVATKGTPEAQLVGDVEIVVCDSETHSVCVPVKRKVEMPFTVGHESAPKKESVRVPLPKAK